MSKRHPKFPKLGSNVEVQNLVTGVWLKGKCIDHLSTQWIFANVGNDGREHEYIIHPNWTWKEA